MLILDLQWLLFFLVVAAVLAVSGWALALRRRSPEARSGPWRYDPGSFQLLDGVPLGVLVLAEDSVSYANPEARDLLHLPVDDPEVLPSADWTELLREDVQAARRDAVEVDAFAEGRYRSVTFASGRTVRWWVSPQGDRDVVVLMDVTGERRAQRAGRTLVSDLGHELRTPIATVLTHLEILGLDDVGAAVHRQSLQLARREAQRMSRLVNDMLELGRLETAETLTRRPLNLLRLVEEAVLETTPRAHDLAISLDVVSDPALPLVLGNDDRLRQVLLNLLDNALKYSAPQDKVTVSLRRSPGGPECAVCDTGPGILPQHLPFVTQRFYRAAPETVEGSGLGLSLVQEVLRHHGSELLIVSPVSEGRGTCAQFVLPAAAAEQGGGA